MSGTGGPSPAEQHLGDRLAALVDGELGHDARERVLAHLATCGKCKAEADAQRRLKSVFAEMAPPGPSEGLLARLQQLPGGDANGPGSRLGSGGLGPGDFVSGGGSFGYVPSGAGRHTMGGVPPQPRARGFRVHQAERPAPQRRRFAFAAAGAVSLAAFALGGALPLEAAVESPSGRVEGTGTAATPLGASPAGDGSPVRGDDLLAVGNSWPRPSAAAPTAAPAPSPMGLSGPVTATPPRSVPALDPAGRFGLSPLTAAAATEAPYRLTPAAAEAIRRLLRDAPRPHPPLEPLRPLITSATPTTPGQTPAQH
ncbi:zf-HC2 domain-containing protein [Streptomyces celluloflavus]|uniref:zf-HC2 domain-containing protein n=1 Tax=Streptomyces celluloflavus TaxID=58344 RepID=UPI0036D9B6B8